MDNKVGNLSFEEFKLYYESTEKVTDRRLSSNTWNYSICVGIIVSIAVIINWSVSNRPFLYLGLAGVLMLCVMAILFCSLWVGQIDDFKHLNNAKFEILNEMAPHIQFDLSHLGSIKSYCPFEKEWQLLQETRAAVEVSRRQIIALKSSNIEYFIPKAFRALFVLIILAIAVAVAFNLGAFIDQRKALPQVSHNPIVR